MNNHKSNFWYRPCSGLCNMQSLQRASRVRGTSSSQHWLAVLQALRKLKEKKSKRCPFARGLKQVERVVKLRARKAEKKAENLLQSSSFGCFERVLLWQRLFARLPRLMLRKIIIKPKLTKLNRNSKLNWTRSKICFRLFYFFFYFFILSGVAEPLMLIFFLNFFSGHTQIFINLTEKKTKKKI